jgi:hypothetical protein
MKIYEIMGFDPIEGDVGIEIEAEGYLPVIKGNKYWKVVPDGSLRDGLEYVHRNPIPISKVKDSLDNLNKNLEEREARPSFSFRTSVHVHVNCLDMEYKHVLNYIYIYLMLESLLVEYCGEGRKCNRFCLRLEDADGSIDLLSALFKSSGNRKVIRDIANDQLRYASINVQALNKFGSLEFRAMRGTVDPKIIVPWVETLVHMRNYSTQFDSPKDVFDRIEDIGFKPFFDEALGEHKDLFDRGDVEYIIARAQSLAIEIPFIEPNISIELTDENRNDKYEYLDGIYTLEFLHAHFGGEIPGDIVKLVDKKRDPFDIILDEMAAEDLAEPEDEEDIERGDDDW